MELYNRILHRRSIRQYSGESIPEASLTKILQAGLLAPTGRNLKTPELILVRDKDVLQALAKCREHGAGFLDQAAAAVIVIGNHEKTDVWTEDCSIAMAYMGLMADELGVGSCWIQGRLRKSTDERTTEQYIRDLLHIPETYSLTAILSLGMPAQEAKPHIVDEIDKDRLHMEQF